MLGKVWFGSVQFWVWESKGTVWKGQDFRRERFEKERPVGKGREEKEIK